MQIEESLPEGKLIMPETKLPSFRHYPLTQGLGFLSLHQRLMIDYFSSLLLNKINRGYLTFSVQDRFLFHRMNTKSSIFTSGGATSENITFGVHE